MENLFLDRNQAHTKLQEFPPSHIAVAYVGQDWDQLIDSSQLQEIILSPTLGTNPRAVDALVEQLGWDNVHFLDGLHAKIYWSSDAVIWGSFNLSNNALGQKNSKLLYEAGAISLSKNTLDSTWLFYNTLLNHAKIAYPSTIEKQQKLGELHRIQNLAIQNNVIEAKTIPHANNHIPKYNQSYFISFAYGEAKFSLDKIKSAIRKNYIPTCKSLNFSEDSAEFLKQGVWVLVYTIDEDNLPVEKCHKDNFYWLYIHNVIRDAYENTPDLPLVVFEWTDGSHEVPTEPFKLTTPVYDALKVTLKNPDFSHFSFSDDTDDVWVVSKSDVIRIFARPPDCTAR